MSTSKCSKTKDQFCRIHNPAPVANSVESVTQKINSLFEKKNDMNSAGKTVPVVFADGSKSDIPIDEKQSIVGIVYKEGHRILVGKIQHPDALYPHTPCCTESKTRVSLDYIEDDENGDYELETLVCDACGEPVAKVYGDFIYNETLIPKI